MESYDVIVIGGGPGGYPAAIRAAQLGARTALIEREWLGGTCLNCGCIPTKTLIAGAERYRQALTAASFGVAVKGVSFDYAAMKKRKEGVVSTLRNGVGALLKAHGVAVLEGTAEFEGRQRLAVSQGGEKTRLKGEKIIIATGSKSAMPGFLPVHERIIESRAFLDLEQLPKSLLVLGGGYIGSELACMAAALGVKVTIVEMLEDVLMLLDRDARQAVRKHMTEALGIELCTGEAMSDIAADGKGVTAKAGDRELSADMLLVAIGRAPVTDGLHLERAGLETDEKGYLAVDGYSRTAVPGLYAIGDVSGRMQLAHAATAQGIAAAEEACGHARRPAETLIPGVIFTMPEVALVGLTESEAREQGVDVEVGKFSFRGLGKALAADETDGFVKWMAAAGSGQLLGATAVGAHATDLIGEACVAIRAELTAAELGRTVHAHPTFAESWMEAAHLVEGSCIHAPPVRRKR